MCGIASKLFYLVSGYSCRDLECGQQLLLLPMVRRCGHRWNAILIKWFNIQSKSKIFVDFVFKPETKSSEEVEFQLVCIQLVFGLQDASALFKILGKLFTRKSGIPESKRQVKRRNSLSFTVILEALYFKLILRRVRPTERLCLTLIKSAWEVQLRWIYGTGYFF